MDAAEARVLMDLSRSMARMIKLLEEINEKLSQNSFGGSGGKNH